MALPRQPRLPHPPQRATEDLLLLLLVGDYTRDNPSFARTSSALAAAVLIDLADHGKLEVDEDGGPVLVDTDVTEHPVLDDALRRLAEESDPTVEDMLAAIVTGLYVRLLDALTTQGYFDKTGDRRWELKETSYRNRLHAELREILIDGAEPDERTGTLIFLLARISVVHRLFHHGSSPRAEDIACGDWVENPVTWALVEADDDWILVDDDSTGTVGTSGSSGAVATDFFTWS